jgi:hypothetical protein
VWPHNQIERQPPFQRPHSITTPTHVQDLTSLYVGSSNLRRLLFLMARMTSIFGSNQATSAVVSRRTFRRRLFPLMAEAGDAPAAPPASVSKPKLSFQEWKSKADAARVEAEASRKALPQEFKLALAESQSKQFEDWVRRKNTIDVGTEVRGFVCTKGVCGGG